MKTELTTKVKALVNELTLPDSKLTAAQLKFWKLELEAIEPSLFRTMEFLTSGLAGKQLGVRHLGIIQAECTRYMDLLQKNQAIPKQLEVLQAQLMAMLLRIFTELETTYENFFINERHMPHCIFLERSALVIGKAEQLVKVMAENNVPARLQSRILSNFKKVTSGKRCTFHELMLTAHSMETMLNICRENPQEFIPEFLEWQLATAKLCATDYIKSFTNKIEAEMKQLPEGADGYEVYEKYHLLERALGIGKAPSHLKERQRRIQKGISVFLCELYMVVQGNFSYNSEQKAFKESRFMVSCSVDVLAHLTRLMIKTELITSPKVQVLSILSKTVETPGIGKALLSQNSLNKKYDAVESSTSAKTKVVLMKLLKLLEEENF